MTSFAPRDPEKDALLSPGNTALVLIDYQNTQFNSIQSMDRKTLMNNAVTLAKAAKAFGIPIILSTVNVQTGRNHDTVPALKAELEGVPSYDRTSINAWEDQEFKAAVEATGRKKLIMGALWTEACLTFPTIDAIDEGYDVYPVVDAVGGTSVTAHETALRRVEQHGAHLVTVPGLLCELERDWNRPTAGDFVKLMIEDGAFLNLG